MTGSWAFNFDNDYHSLRYNTVLGNPSSVYFVSVMSVNTCGKKPNFFRSLLGQPSGLMILLSVGLHSAIAIFPVRETPELPEQAILESLPPLTVTRLPEPSPVAVPDNADAKPIAPQPAPQIVIPQPILPIEPEPKPLSVMTELPEDMSVENAPEESIPDENGTTGNEEDEPQSPQFTEAEIASMADVWDGFLEGLVLADLESGFSRSNLQQILSAYGETEKEELFFDVEKPRFPLISEHLLASKTPTQVFEDIVSPGLIEREGFEVRDYGEFADGPVYEVVRGELVHYLNIVPLGVDSVLIVSDRPPGE